MKKVLPLDEAIRRNVRGGMLLHLATTHTIPYGSIYEIIRQFHGKNPEFRIVTLAAFGNVQMMVAAGLVREIITSYAGDAYPSPRPSPVFQRAFREGLKIENWSTLTIPLRLFAGALNIDYIPVRSIIGSSMEEENIELKSLRRDRNLGLARAIKPDLSIMHACCSDENGNAVIAPPVSEGLWGEYAAKEGVLLTCERIVPTEEIRKYFSYPRIPGCIVKAVVELPFGAHPGAHVDVEEYGYAEDLDFLLSYRKSAKSPERLDSWLKEWIFDIDHEGYLRKLGKERLSYLRGKSSPDFWKSEIIGREISGEKPTKEEKMISVAARKIVERIKEKKYEIILAGQGASNLAAWLAKVRIPEAELIAEIGFYGYDPRPGSPYIFNLANLPTSKMITDAIGILGILSRKSIAILSGAQIDKNGNINSTRVGDFFIVGSGGANDAISLSREVIVLIPQDPARLVENAPYVTGNGERVKLLITTSGVFEKIDGEFYLSSIFPGESIESIKKRTGWRLKVLDEVKVEEVPSKEDLALLRAYDPEGYFIR